MSVPPLVTVRVLLFGLICPSKRMRESVSVVPLATLTLPSKFKGFVLPVCEKVWVVPPLIKTPPAPGVSVTSARDVAPAPVLEILPRIVIVPVPE